MRDTERWSFMQILDDLSIIIGQILMTNYKSIILMQPKKNYHSDQETPMVIWDAIVPIMTSL